LRVAAYQLLFLRTPDYAAVDDAVGAARAIAGDKVSGFTNAVLRKLATAKEPALPTDDSAASYAIRYSMPVWLVEAILAVANCEPRELAPTLHAFTLPPPLIARVNVLRATPAELIAELAAEGVAAIAAQATPNALILDGGDPGRSPSFAAGRWTVQDTGAQRVALMAKPAIDRATQPLRILDACAGVGGKSTHLAELTCDRASIDAADLSKTKLKLLAATAARLGTASIKPIKCDLLDPAAPLAHDYDLIVLDAPCSGLGVIRRHPDAKWRVDRADVTRMIALQAQLLDAIAPRLAAGGTLIYSVCTFVAGEGRDQIAAFCARTGFTLEASEDTWPDAPDQPDAFYLARLRKPEA
jgi:16S rRNA (cytosine967-C5)-methyltransferase